jgi:glucose-1-phosphate cytidylyltransferase
MHSEIPVVMLCGGQGTRIREASERLPKAMVEIGGRPILWHIMKLYGYYGYRRFVLCLGYKGWEIKRYLLDYRVHTQGETRLIDSA